jgi:flagellin-like hook-associated protein FlgL
MNIRVLVLLVVACCAGLTGCTAAASSGPDVTVTDPSVGKPAAPDSVEAALSRMAFTPYAALGLSDDDGLAPNESSQALSAACMSTAGYPDGPNTPFAVRVTDAGLAFSQPYGAWGYLGLADAEQFGFLQPAGSAMSSLGIDTSSSPPNPSTLPAAEQTALGKCATIVGGFTNDVDNGPLAGISAITNDIYTDMQKDAQVISATKAWSTCMSQEGYDYPDPSTGVRDELESVFDQSGPGMRITIGGSSVSPAANKAQIAMAVADADCTSSTDLAGIYFAIQAGYEQQIVNANQQALTAAVQRFRADYQKEIGRLPALLKTAKATPFPRGTPDAK